MGRDVSVYILCGVWHAYVQWCVLYLDVSFGGIYGVCVCVRASVRAYCVV